MYRPYASVGDSCPMQRQRLAACRQQAGAPDKLLCEWKPYPLNVERPAPRLSWKSGVAKQSAYQIQVASRPDLLAAQAPDLWDSGKVDSDVSLNIPYAGKRLESRQACYWRVRVWGDKAAEAGPWSAPSHVGDGAPGKHGLECEMDSRGGSETGRRIARVKPLARTGRKYTRQRRQGSDDGPGAST